MIKKDAQKTEIDDVLHYQREKANYKGDDKHKQLELTRQDLPPVQNPYWYGNSANQYKPKEKWLPDNFIPTNREKYWQEDARLEEVKRKEQREPLNLKYPELTPEQIRFRKLNPNETDELLDQEKRELGERSRWFPANHEEHNKPPEAQQYFDLNKASPEEIRRQILETYNTFRVAAAKFKAAYEDANHLTNTDVSMDYTGTYYEIIKRLPDYIERTTKLGIGSIFGLTNEKDETSKKIDRASNTRAHNLLSFMEKGINIINLTPLNFEIKKKELISATEDMLEIVAEYERRKKVLIRLPKEIGQYSISYLRRKDNREFLKWCDQYFPTEKENFIKQSLNDMLSYHGSNAGFDIASLKTMKTYSAIYSKAIRSMEWGLRSKMEGRAREVIYNRIEQEVKEAIGQKLEGLKTVLAETKKEDISPLEKYLFANFKFDLRGILQFCSLTFKNVYKESEKENWETMFSDFKGSMIEDIKTTLSKENIFTGKEGYGRDIFKDTISNFLDKHSPRGGLNDRKALDNLQVGDIDKLGNSYIAKVMVFAIPNFSSDHTPNKYRYPDFKGAGEIVANTGSLRIDGTIQHIADKVPFIPKEFIAAAVKSAFRGAATGNASQTFQMLSKLGLGFHNKTAIFLLAMLKKENKYNPDGFTYAFNNSFEDLDDSVSFFVNNYSKYKELTDTEFNAVLSLAFKSFAKIPEYKERFEKFIKYLHDTAGSLSKKDFFKLLENPNFAAYHRVGISRKLIDAIALIKEVGGVKGLEEKYSELIKTLQEKNFISKKFLKNVVLVISLFNSGREINPAHPQFQKIVEAVSTIETDIQMLQMNEEMKELIKYYQKKDSRLFNLNFEINPNLRFRVLKDMDPRILTIGIETNCCQRIGGAGEDAAKQSFINPMAGVVILEWKDDDEWKILTQSYFHYIPKDNGYILDNVEYNAKNYRQSQVNLEAAYALLGEKIKKEFDVSYFLAGKDYSKIAEKDFKTKRLEGGDPRFFADGASNYSDFTAGNAINLLRPTFKLDKEREALQGQPKKEAYTDLLSAFYKLASG